MKIVAALIVIFALCFMGCASLTQPSSNIDPKLGPICDRAEYADSWICQELRKNGFANAEDARDLILDANDISLLLDVYTVDQLKEHLDKWDMALDNKPISYALYLSGVIEDTAKAERVSSILKRRFGYLLSYDGLVRDSDKKLLRLLNISIREASGIH